MGIYNIAISNKEYEEYDISEIAKHKLLLELNTFIV